MKTKLKNSSTDLVGRSDPILDNNGNSRFLYKQILPFNSILKIQNFSVPLIEQTALSSISQTLEKTNNFYTCSKFISFKINNETIFISFYTDTLLMQYQAIFSSFSHLSLS